MNQEEADQDVVDEVSEEADSRGKVMRSDITCLVSSTMKSKTDSFPFEKNLIKF